MNWQNAVDAGSFVSFEDFVTDFRDGGSTEVGFERRACEALNAAAAFLRNRTGRELRSKLWRSPITMSEITWVDPGDADGAESATITTNLGAFSGLVFVGDDVYGEGALVGQRVTAVRTVEVDLSSSWTRETAPQGNLTMVFGSAPMYVSGDGSCAVDAIQYPVTEVLSCAYRDGAAWVDVDVTDANFAPFDLGRIEFGTSLPSGFRNVRLEVRAGYVEPGTTAGHPAEWQTLRRLSLMIAREYFNADARGTGGGSFAPIGGSRGAPGSELSMPAAVLEQLTPFMRFV